MSDVDELLALEQTLMAAILARNVTGLEHVLGDSFELRVPGNPPVDRAAFIAGVLAIPGKILTVESEDVRATVFGEVGVLTGQQRAKVLLDDGSTVADVQVFTDIAVRQEGRWRMLLAHSTPLAVG
jgi:Domain of unknown function (DUF4440)